MAQEVINLPDNRDRMPPSGDANEFGDSWFEAMTKAKNNFAEIYTLLANLDTTELGYLNGVTAGTVAASKALVADANARIAGLAGLTSSVAALVAGFMPTAVQQAIDADGAINLTSFYTAVTSVGTTGQAFTLADATVIGHMKKIQMIVDDGDATVTFNTSATLVFADVGDFAVLIWNGTDWIPVELGNSADGATGPAYTPAA